MLKLTPKTNTINPVYDYSNLDIFTKGDLLSIEKYYNKYSFINTFYLCELAKEGHLDCLRMLYTKGIDISNREIFDAAFYSNKSDDNVVKYLESFGHKINENNIKCAILADNKSIIKYLTLKSVN